MKTPILIAFIITAASLCFAKQANNFTVTETKTSLQISEAGKKVCAYQKIPDSKPHSRSHYFHPVYDLSENVLTEDFPADHLHHHGLWWAWHQIRKNGKQIADGWMNDNIHWDVKKLTHSSMQDGGLLVIMNVDWLTNDNKLLVKELSEAVRRQRQGLRRFFAAIEKYGKPRILRQQRKSKTGKHRGKRRPLDELHQAAGWEIRSCHHVSRYKTRRHRPMDTKTRKKHAKPRIPRPKMRLRPQRRINPEVPCGNTRRNPGQKTDPGNVQTLQTHYNMFQIA